MFLPSIEISPANRNPSRGPRSELDGGWLGTSCLNYRFEVKQVQTYAHYRPDQDVVWAWPPRNSASESLSTSVALPTPRVAELTSDFKESQRLRAKANIAFGRFDESRHEARAEHGMVFAQRPGDSDQIALLQRPQGQGIDKLGLRRSV